MRSGDWPGRAPPLPDVPIERDTIGAMRVTAGSQYEPDNFCVRFVPYVYRGTGFDILTPGLGEDWERGKGKPKPETHKVKKRKPRVRKSKPRREYKPRLYPYYGPEHVLEPPPDYEPEPDPFEFLETMDSGDAPEHFKRRPSMRPSPDWTPPTGADLDAWMEEFDV